MDVITINNVQFCHKGRPNTKTAAVCFLHRHCFSLIEPHFTTICTDALGIDTTTKVVAILLH